MKFDVVIAHYKEDLDWIRGLDHPSIRKVFVYSKSIPAKDLSSERVEHRYLTNVGRESHTYLWHCVHSRTEMEKSLSADFTFFVQGSPHAMDAKAIKDWMELVESTGMDFTHNYRVSDPREFLDGGRCRTWGGPTYPSDMTINEWCERYVREGATGRFPIFWNACFGVSTRCLLRCERPRLVTLIQQELSSLNPECGHFCERLWYYIFNMDSAPKIELPDDTWHFWGGPGGANHYGIMKLNADGTVGVYRNPNESLWRAEGSSIVLMNANMEPTSVLERTSASEYSGPFLGGQNSLHRLTRDVPSHE